MKFKTKREAQQYIRISFSEAYAARLRAVRSSYWDVKKEGWRSCWIVKVVKLRGGA